MGSRSSVSRLVSLFEHYVMLLGEASGNVGHPMLTATQREDLEVFLDLLEVLNSLAFCSSLQCNPYQSVFLLPDTRTQGHNGSNFADVPACVQC